MKRCDRTEVYLEEFRRQLLRSVPISVYNPILTMALDVRKVEPLNILFQIDPTFPFFADEER